MIETRGLRHRYASGPDLPFPDLALPAAAVLLVRGRSGAGKSTFLALAAGLRMPSAGDIVVAGQSLAALAPAARDAWRGRTIGFLPQQLHLSHALTVAQNLALPYYAGAVPVDRAAIGQALDTLGLGGLGHRRPGQLSGGQAQRVALARALLRRPPVILADEPTASLDDEAAATVLRLLKDAAHGVGATLVIATHDARVHAALPAAVLYEIGLQPALVMPA